MNSNTWKYILLAVFLAVSVVLLGYALTLDPKYVPSPLIGKASPEFNLELLNGKRLSSQDLKGKVVLVNFWASWCLACRDEHPILTELPVRYKDKNLEVLGIVYQDTQKNIKRYLKQYGGGYTVAFDPKSRTAIEFGIFGVPESFIINRQGHIVHKQIGPITWETVKQHLVPLL